MYQIQTAAVIGAGTMGLGIAGQLANAGIDVVLLDIPAEGANRNARAERALERLQDPKQPGLLHGKLLRHITIGNVEDDLEKVAHVDWIAEAIVERLDAKKSLYARIDAVRKPGSIVTSNTSTIPISLLVSDMPASFCAEFAVTHFFNPVRYMQLLELVRGTKTDDRVIECLAEFCDLKLGKGIVECRDTPGFLANRVGVFAMQKALHTAIDMGLTPEQADAIFGRPLGIPKTGVFGLYDLIGIDLMADVVQSLASILPSNDAFHAVAGDIPIMKRMIQDGQVGNKGGKGGFYRSADPASGHGRQVFDAGRSAYRDCEPCKPPAAVEAEISGDFTGLIEADDEFGTYGWEVLSHTLCYAASLVPEVSDSIVAIDDAMKLGYNWSRGPFEMIDVIGVDRFIARLEREARPVPGFLRSAAGESFYRAKKKTLRYFDSDGGFSKLKRAPGIRRFSEDRRVLEPIDANDSASFFQVEGNIGLVEFHSKANALGPDSMYLLAAAVDFASRWQRGLIIHNDAPHFSCGADLGTISGFIENRDMAGLDAFLAHYQATLQAMKNAPVPVVAAPSGLSVGGGFEVLLHTDKVIYHANSTVGLVETLVGVVPGGGGAKEMLYRWMEHEDDINKAAWSAFKNIGYGRTARSPLEARELAMYRDGVDEFIMNRDRLLQGAIDAVRDLARGYAVEKRQPLAMPGRDVGAEMREWLQSSQSRGELTPHDVTVGGQIAMIVTGGDVDAGTQLSENDLLNLERKAFVSLAQTTETRDRMRFMLEHGTPLRN